MSMGIHPVTLDGRRDIGGGAVELQFRARRPLGQAAGQHALWQIPGGGIKPFTIASAPEESRVTLATNAHSHSRLKRALGNLQLGGRVRLAGPMSAFTLAGAGAEVVLLAQGIGVTPFHAMLNHIAAADLDVAATLVHVGATDGPFAGHAYRDDTEQIAHDCFYVAGREQFAQCLDAVASARPGATFFASGSPAFVTETLTALGRHGVSADQIRRDSFAGWTGPTHPASQSGSASRLAS